VWSGCALRVLCILEVSPTIGDLQAMKFVVLISLSSAVLAALASARETVGESAGESARVRSARNKKGLTTV
jgi:hypothetical protein